jgi:ectoine hydroxylase-related dioxygenase (phytanoyl-CoA dioxygenase family)
MKTTWRLVRLCKEFATLSAVHANAATPPIRLSHHLQVTRLVQGGLHLQAAMNFHDNKCEDGGTLVVPRFHRALQAWTHEHRGALYKPCPWVTFDPPPPSATAAAADDDDPVDCNVRIDSGDSEGASESAVAHQWLLRRARRVPMREGSVLLWNQTLAHGTCPNASRCAPARPSPQSLLLHPSNTH